jgi:uncharacterized protein involved in outer membrane biogenesis
MGIDMKARRLAIWIGGGVVLVAGGLAGFLATLDVDSQRGRLAGLLGDALGRQVTIDGPLRLAPSLVPTLSAGGLKLANVAGGSRPEMATVGRVEIQVELLPLLRREIHVRRIVLADVDVLLERDKSGAPNWRFDTLKSEAPARAGQPNATSDTPLIDSLSLRDVRFAYVDAAAGTRREARFGRLDVSIAAVSSTLAAEGNVLGHAVAADLVLAPLKELLAGVPTAINGHATVDGVKLAVDGTVAAPLAATGLAVAVTIDAADLATLGRLAGADLPAIGPVKVAAKVSDKDAAWRADEIDARIGPNAFRGWIGFRPGVRPRLDGDIAAEHLDLDALLGGGKSSTVRQPDGRVIPAASIAIDALPPLDAGLALRATSLRLGGLSFERVSLNAGLGAKGLEVKPFAFELAGGRFDGMATLTRATNPDLVLDARVAKLDLAAFLKAVGGTEGVTGRVDAEVSLAGRGRDLRQLAGGLKGRTFVALGKGTIASRWLDYAAADLVKAISPFSPAQEDTRMNCAVSRFEIAKGKAVSRAFLFDTTRMTVTGDGTVDLGSEAVAFTLSPRPKDRSLLSLATDLKVAGTIAKPTVAPDALGVAKNVAQIAGGVALGPLGLLVPLATTGNDDKNPCVEAIASKGKPAPKEEEGTLDKIGKDIGGALDDLGSALNPF